MNGTGASARSHSRHTCVRKLIVTQGGAAARATAPCLPRHAVQQGRPNGLVGVSVHGHGHRISPICRVCTQIPAPMETLLDYTCTRVHAYTCVYTCIVLWYEPLHVSRPWRERRPGSPLNPLTAKIRRTWKEVLPVSSKRAPRLG